MFFTVDEVADKLQLNPETIRRYIQAKELERFLETRSNKKKA